MRAGAYSEKARGFVQSIDLSTLESRLEPSRRFSSVVPAKRMPAHTHTQNRLCLLHSASLFAKRQGQNIQW